MCVSEKEKEGGACEPFPSYGERERKEEVRAGFYRSSMESCVGGDGF